MTVVERKTDAIQTQAGEELGIRILEEILKKFIEEELLLFLPENFEHSSSVLGFMAGITGTYEMLVYGLMKESSKSFT
jgi:hypothetical protein